MGKIMTNIELIERMKELLNEPNFYGSGGNKWSSWQDGKGWYVDCTCSIKAILWGGRFIEANRGYAHAGCNYGSNGVPDFTPQSCVNWTNATKGNFGNLVPGEILLMTSQSHAGLYIGNGEVIEVTPAWTGGTPGCQISQIGVNGERIKNGSQVYSWEYHGKIPVVEYVEEYNYEEIEKKEIVLNKDTSLWNLTFNSWNNAKSVEDYKKGDRFLVVATYKHSLGGKYYILESDYKKNHYGFNIVDCDDYVETPQNLPVEEEKQEDSINTLPNEETSKEEEKTTEYDDIPSYYEDKENALLWLIDKIVELLHKIFSKKS